MLISICLTGAGDNPWLQLDLGQVYEIKLVTIRPVTMDTNFNANRKYTHVLFVVVVVLDVVVVDAAVVDDDDVVVLI